VLETAFKQRELPLRVVGGAQFYERKEVKDLIAYLRIALNRLDEISLRRIINYPARGVGPAAVQRLTTYALAHDLTLWAAVETASSVDGLQPSAAHGCSALAAVLNAAAQRISDGEPSAQVARHVIAAAAIDADIDAGSGSNAVAVRRRENLTAVIGVLERFDQSNRGAHALANLLRLLSLNTEAETQDPGNVVTLSTMHGAKGLEFTVVFIAGAEEGLIPHARTIDMRATDVDPQDIEEERRLFYVAVTRAMQRLYICRAKHRMLRGKQAPRTPCRFLSNVPGRLVETREVHHMNAPSTQDLMDGVSKLLAALQ
jgi:superfamily I DNA/RNA helicase